MLLWFKDSRESVFRPQFEMLQYYDLGNQFDSVTLFSNYFKTDHGHIITLRVRNLTQT